MGAGIAYTFVRKLGIQGEDSRRIVLIFSAFSCALCLPGIVFFHAPMSFRQLGFLMLAGLCGCVAQFAITRAYLYAPAKELSVYDYTQVIFATVWGFLLFGQVPDGLSVLGYLLHELVAVKFGGKCSWDELGLPVTETGLALPCGATGRWCAE